MRNKRGKLTKLLKPEGKKNITDKKQIFAFALSKYVFKSGRETIPPEIAFKNGGLMPSRLVESTRNISFLTNSSLVNGSVVIGAAVLQEYYPQ